MLLYTKLNKVVYFFVKKGGVNLHDVVWWYFYFASILIFINCLDINYYSRLLLLFTFGNKQYEVFDGFKGRFYY